ncbi:MAG: alpha/beta fold hydrolase [Beijerinckiaceae bacterium]|nr:alpha/beta fold hydrolase [Beijerinckiaceae bacterium]
MQALRSFLIVAVSVYLALVAALFFMQRSLLYLPNPSDMEAMRATMPGVERLTLKSADGETLVAWHHPPREGQPVFIYLHGNGANLTARNRRLMALVEQGWGFLGVSYRGYGGSTGSPTEDGLIADAEAGYAKARELGFDSNRIFLFGESLGSGVAIALAAKREVRGVVLESPFSSIADVAAAIYWYVPVRYLLHDQFRSDERVKNVRAPLFIMHGDADRVVPIGFGEKLFAAANEPKELFRVPGAGHQPLDHPPAQRRLVEWVNEVMKGK